MTVLSACQKAAVVLVSKQISAVFAASDPFALELQYLANEVATDIAKSQDWQALTKIYAFTGTGTQTEFPLPADYDRMLLDSDIYDQTNWAWGYIRIIRLNDWLEWQIRDWQLITPGAWTLLDNKLQFLPAPPQDNIAKFLYISNLRVIDDNDVLKSEFTADTDSFLLPERLLTLGIIWRWKEMKGLDATVAASNFVKAFNEYAGREKGARIVTTGSVTRRGLYGTAYPWALGS